MALITSLSFFVGAKNSLEKLMFCCLVHFALRTSENVAAKYGHGTFEIVATKVPRKLP
jgi:hypothetical protein